MRKLIIFFNVLISTIFLNAQWNGSNTQNNVICNATSNQNISQVISDGNGGAIIIYTDFRSGNLDIYAQKINNNGVLQWATNGIAVCNAINEQRYPSAISDGNGGAIIVWSDKRNGNTDIYAQKIDGNGVLQWASNGVVVCNAQNEQGNSTIISDGLGNFIISWDDYRSGFYGDIYAQKLSSSGTILWANNGVVVCNAGNDQYLPAISSDGNGGAYFTWTDFRSSKNVYAQRINSSGTPQWTNNGILLSDYTSFKEFPSIVTLSNNEAIIVWRDYRNSDVDLFAQKVNLTGNLQWNSSGIPVTNINGNQYVQKMITNTSDEVLITWRDSRNGNEDIYAQKINGSGTTLWTTNGVAVCNDVSNQMQPEIISSGNGGAIITWYDERNSSWGSEIYAQKLDGNGNSTWLTNGIRITMVSNPQLYPKIVTDGNNGALIFWDDNREQTLTGTDIYGSRIFDNGNLLSTSEGVSKENFKIFPNPVKDFLHIQTDRKIESITILDSNGRKILEQKSNSKNVNLKDLPKGIYFIQIISDNKKSVSKFIKD